MAKLARGHLLPILVVNSNNQSIRLSKGCIMAKLENVTVDEIKIIHQIAKNSGGSKEVNWPNNVQVPMNIKGK